MVNGAIKKGALRFIVSATGSMTHSGDGTGSFTASCDGYTLFVPDIIDVAAGFSFSVYTYDNGDGTGVHGTGVYDGPGAPSGGLTVSAPGGGTLEVRLTDLVVWTRIDGSVHQVDFTLQVFFDGTRVLGDGVKGGAYSFSYVGSGFGSMYVPLLGCLGADTSVHCATQNVPDHHQYDNYSWNTTVTGQVSIAYELQDEGSSTWYGLPVTVPSNPTVSGTTSSAIVVTGTMVDSRNHSFDGPVPTPGGPTLGPSGNLVDQAVTRIAQGSFIVVPSEGTHDLVRMMADYRSTIFRSGFPKTTRLDTVADTYTHGGWHSFSDGYDHSTRTETQVHPSLSSYKGSVGDASEPVLEALTYPCYAAVQASDVTSTTTFTEVYNAYGNSPGFNPDSGIPDGYNETKGTVQGTGVVFPYFVEDYDTNEDLLDWQYHANTDDGLGQIMRYLAAWGSPFFKYGHWAPQSPSIDDAGFPTPQSQWPLDGAASSVLYWRLGRTCWAGEASLASAERTNKRGDRIASAEEASGLTTVYDQFWPPYTIRPIGWSRSPVMDCGPGGAGLFEDCPASLDLRADSAPSWGSDDATLSFGAGGVTVTPKSASQTTATLTLNLGGWLGPPFFYPTTCGSVTLGFSGAAELDVSFASALGGTDLVGSVSDGSTVTIPRGTDRGYAGSYGTQNGVPDPENPGSFFTADKGLDVAPGGKSAATMADAARAQSFEGLTGGQASRLVLTITLDRDGSGNALAGLVRYPTFHRASGNPTIVWESGQCAAILWPDGPGIRWGNWQFYDGEEFLSVPNVLGLGYTSTVVDAIAWRRAVMQGVSPLSGGTTGTGTGTAIPPLTTELAQRYTAFEGQSIGQVDRDSWSLPVNAASGHVYVLLGNSYSETPPMAMFMAHKRDPVTYQPTGSPGGQVYDLCKGPRDVISPTTALQVYDPSGTLLSSSQSAPSGWKIERYDPAVTNAEPATYELRQGASGSQTTFAKVRPWHGWFWLGQAGQLAKILAGAVSRNLRHARVVEKDGGIAIQTSNNLRPFTFSAGSSLGAADWARIAYPTQRRDDPAAVLYGPHGGTATLAVSPDEGVTLIPQFTIADADYADHAFTPSGDLYVFRLKSGAIYGRLYDALLNPVGSEWTTSLTGVDDSPIDVTISVGSSGELRIHVQYFASGSVVFATSSTGGADFS